MRSTFALFRGTLPAAFLALTLSPLAAQVADRWVAHGPEGGEVLSLLPDPLEPGVVYAGTLGGNVFVSRDNGGSWRQAGGGLLVSRVDALARSAAPGAPVYAGTDRGVFRLNAGATSWQPVNTGLPPESVVGRLVADPAAPATLYTLVSQGRITGSWALYKTTDGGARWTLAPGAIQLDPVLAVAPTSPPTLYTASSQGVHRSTDRGATWEISATGLPATVSLVDVAAVPGSPGTLYAGALRLTQTSLPVWKSVDGGRSWAAASQGIPSFASALRFAADPERPVVYLGTSTGMVRTTDGGASWTEASAGPANRTINAVAVSPSGGTVFAGGARYFAGGDVGVLRSSDGGESWQSLTAGLLASSIVTVSPDPRQPGRILAATETQGLFRSDDAGAHWARSDAGIEEGFAGPFVRDPFVPSTVYALAGESTFMKTRLYRSTDSGLSWAAVGEEQECCLNTLTADPHSRDTLYVTRAESLLKSTDGGASWQVIHDRFLCQIQALAFHPTNPGWLIGGCSRDSGLPVSPPIIIAEILQSTDGGVSWRESFESDGQAVYSTLSLAFDPNDGNRAFAGIQSLEGGGLYRSHDAGASWSKVEGLDGRAVQAVAVDPVRQGQIFLGTARHGVLRSLDTGATWQPYNDGLGSASVAALAFDPVNPAKVWAGTGGGVYSVVREAATPCAPSPTELCLHGGRFRVEVDWEDFSGNTGRGQTVPLTDATGAFWFFGPTNLEMAVKVLDGSPVNGQFWVFFGGLSTVRYTITVTDTASGLVKRYENPSGRLASFGDTSAFPASGASRGAAGAVRPAAPATKATNLHSFLLHEERFAVEVRWRIDAASTGFGTGIPLSRDTAAVWFFGPENLELFVKILDGRPVNGHYWIFFGALSNVGFEVIVTDTETGARRVYENPPGTFGSRVDVELF